MSWVVELTVPADESDIVSYELWNLGTNGVAESSSAGDVTLVAGFETEARALGASAQLRRFSPSASPCTDTWAGPEETTFLVSGQAMTIDAGRAFGHGAHSTTALLLGWLHDVDLAGTSVLDVGTGTGVLAIAATKLGAVSVLGIDNDLAAIESARLNMERNGVDFTLSDRPVAQLAEPADIVVANMLLPHLLSVADDLIRLTRHTLLVSGVIDVQANEIAEALAPLAVVETRVDGDWRALRLERP